MICVESNTLGSVRDTVQGVSTMARKAISLRSVQLIGAETSVASPSTLAPEMITQRPSGRSFKSRGASASASRGDRGRGRGSVPRMQTETHSQARVYAVTRQDANVAPHVVTGIISILDRDEYPLVVPGATHLNTVEINVA